mmetsp:Transcript_3662/g.6470  ORF Transcript_3662/g.6470 Transcript_3662/m.6470 type:complete len:221 (-) Transcript_3662:360-1022(-)
MHKEKESYANNDDEELSVASDDISIDVQARVPDPEAEDATLSWRNDPSYNFSDWKLQVIIQENPAGTNNGDGDNDNDSDNSSTQSFHEKTYNVHRNILAIGERRSGYFANLLHYGIDDGNQCSRIELASRAAACFPDLLDYMYSSKAFAITTKKCDCSVLFVAGLSGGLPRSKDENLYRQGHSTIQFRMLPLRCALFQRGKNCAKGDRYLRERSHVAIEL